jgi:hypothetical protein
MIKAHQNIGDLILFQIDAQLFDTDGDERLWNLTIHLFTNC